MLQNRGEENGAASPVEGGVGFEGGIQIVVWRSVGVPWRVQSFVSPPEAAEVDFGRLLAPTWGARGLWTSPGQNLGAILGHF